MKLRDDQLEELREAARCTVRPGVHTQMLASLGLVVNGHGRFGGWVKATDEGQQYLARMASRGGRATSKQVPAPVETKPDSFAPAATTGPARAGKLLRGAAPRTRRVAAKNARSRAAISPPAAAQSVGAPSSPRADKTGSSKGGAGRRGEADVRYAKPSPSQPKRAKRNAS